MADRVRTPEETTFEKERQFANELLSALTTLPAELLATKLATMFPDSFRSPFIASGLNGAFASLDAAADRVSNPLGSAAMQLLADFGKNVGGKLCDPKKPAAGKVYIDKGAWFDAFWADARKRLGKAKDHKVMWAEIQKDFQTQLEGLDELNQKMAEHDASKNCAGAPISLEEEWKKLQQSIGKDTAPIAKTLASGIRLLAEKIDEGTPEGYGNALQRYRAAIAAKKQGGK